MVTKVLALILAVWRLILVGGRCARLWSPGIRCNYKLSFHHEAADCIADLGASVCCSRIPSIAADVGELCSAARGTPSKASGGKCRFPQARELYRIEEEA